jgi:hypothetical protein
MASEQVLFDDRKANVTVTNERLIIGDDVFAIESLSHAAFADSRGLGEYIAPVIFALLAAVAGIAMLLSFSFWSIIGLLLLWYPVSVVRSFGKKDKAEYWVFIYSRSGDAIEHGEFRPKYTQDVAKRMTDAINGAIKAYRIANDPRRNLRL